MAFPVKYDGVPPQRLSDRFLMFTTKAKVIFLGDSGVGKTSIVVQQERRYFDGHYVATLGATFVVSTVQIANEYVQFQIWDTAGQERFRSMVPMYLRNSKAAFVVYDITNRKSFEDVTAWIEDIHRWVADPIEIVILANKSDLEASRMVSNEEGSALAQSFGCKYFETSAKNDSNIDAPFKFVAEQLLLKKSRAKKPESICLTLETTEKKKKKCC